MKFLPRFEFWRKASCKRCEKNGDRKDLWVDAASLSAVKLYFVFCQKSKRKWEEKKRVKVTRITFLSHYYCRLRSRSDMPNCWRSNSLLGWSSNQVRQNGICRINLIPKDWVKTWKHILAYWEIHWGIPTIFSTTKWLQPFFLRNCYGYQLCSMIAECTACYSVEWRFFLRRFSTFCLLSWDGSGWAGIGISFTKRLSNECFHRRFTHARLYFQRSLELLNWKKCK